MAAGVTSMMSIALVVFPYRSAHAPPLLSRSADRSAWRENSLKVRITNHRTKLLICTRVCTRLACDACRGPGDSYKRVAQQSCASSRHEVMPSTDRDFHASRTRVAGRRCGGQRIDHWLCCARGIVADPEIEKIAEDDEFAMARRVRLHETKEAAQRRGPLDCEMEVCDENGIEQRRDRSRHRQGRRRLDQTQVISARSISTSISGTSWCDPWRAVRNALILSIVSRPSVTLPNTQ